MKVITEMDLRCDYRKSEFTSFSLPVGCRLTPAAAQFLSERRIKVLQGDNEPAPVGAVQNVAPTKTQGTPVQSPLDPNPVQPDSQSQTDSTQLVSEISDKIQKQIQENFMRLNQEKQNKNVGEIETGVSTTTDVAAKQEGKNKIASCSAEQFTVDDFGGVKPEYMTHLAGTTLVMKNHPRIKFRGKLDSYEALLINTIVDVKMQGYHGLATDLTEILNYLKELLRSEVIEEPLKPLEFHGWSEQEIHERSHYPKKYYGVDHLSFHASQGKLMAQLNTLRASVREMELCALDVFLKSPEEVERPDIVMALNRMSSLIYVIIIQLVAGIYRMGC